jgi:hypothetical protein
MFFINICTEFIVDIKEQFTIDNTFYRYLISFRRSLERETKASSVNPKFLNNTYKYKSKILGS